MNNNTETNKEEDLFKDNILIYELIKRSNTDDIDVLERLILSNINKNNEILLEKIKYFMQIFPERGEKLNEIISNNYLFNPVSKLNKKLNTLLHTILPLCVLINCILLITLWLFK